MKIVIQRVSNASVAVDGKIIGEIARGLLLLVGFGRDDTDSDFSPIIDKVINMRIFANDEGRFDKSVLDLGGALLLVPQFTLFADCSRGRRPEFFSAMAPDQAKQKFSEFAEQFKKRSGLQVQTGQFGADMKVSLLNDGPVTIIL